MQNLRCVRCLKDYDPANNAFGACTWHSNHNFAKSTPTYVSIEEELRTVLPRFKTSFGKVDIEYILSKITLKDLMLQIDSPVTRAIRGKLDTIPESIAKLLVEYPVEKLYDVISSRYSYDKQYQPTKRMALIMENMLTSMRIEDIDAQLKDETDRLDTQFRYPHPHLFRGKYFAGGRYVWRCCGLPETVEGCWTGVHSSVQRSPDPFTVANFENANYRAFYDNINLIVNGSEHVNNPIKNQTLRTLCSSSIGANFNTKKQEFIKKVIAFNFYNGYEPTFIRAEGVQFGCSWQESERVQSCRDEKVEDLIEFSNLRLLVVFHPPRYRLSEYTITTVVHKLTRGVIFKSDEVFQYGSMIPLQPDLYLPIPANSRLPEGTLLLPNSATRYLPRNPVSVTQATLAEFELLESQPSNRLKRRQRVRITQLSDAEWAPYEALRQAQLNSAIAEYQKQQRRAGELAVRRQTADQLLLDVQNAVRQSTRIPGSEPFVKLVEKMVTKQYDELFGLPRKQQIALLRDMNATVDLAGIVLRQKDLEDQITQGSLVITTPLTPEESNDFQKDIAEIMKRTDAARTEYDQALQKTKASPETKQLGLETLQILGEHTEFLRKAASGVKLYEEATIITESSSKVLETFEHLRDLFVKGRFGRAVVVNVVVPKEFHSKLMKIDMRLKNWHLKNTIPGVDKEEKLQELYQFYSKLRSFKEKYSPLKFSTNLKEDVTLVAREADQAFTDALQALNLGKLDEPSVIQIVDLLNTAIESSRVWSIKVRSFSGEVISTDELQRFIFYDNIEKELNMDIDEEKESMFEKFLTLTPPNFEELDIFAKARIVLYHNLLTFCSQTALFHKFVYKMQDWLQRYVAYQFQSVGEEYVIFDPVFGHEVVGNNGISFVASGLEAGFVANLVNNGYTVASYNALTLENFNVMKVLFQRISELNSPALMKTLAALKKEVNSIQTASAQRADFFQVCQAYETTDFLYVDGIFPEWDRIEKLDETFGYGKGFMRTKYKLDSVLELYQEIQKVVGRLKLYFENFYIFDEENKYLDQIARRNIDYFSNISEKVLKEIVETARQLLKTLSWTKRFRSKEDLGDLIKLWTEINFPINNASRYGEKVTRVIDYLRKMNLLIGVTENQIQGIFRQINSAGKDFQKIVPDVVLPLSNSCKVELTNYVVPKVLQPGDIQSPLNLVRNLEKLKFNPKFYLHPPKGIKFKAEVHSVVHVYEVQ
jgi:flagellar biosynthesis/type III secretory pathway chaperone